MIAKRWRSRRVLVKELKTQPRNTQNSNMNISRSWSILSQLHSLLQPLTIGFLKGLTGFLEKQVVESREGLEELLKGRSMWGYLQIQQAKEFHLIIT
jgi:hypothetical protein